MEVDASLSVADLELDRRSSTSTAIGYKASIMHAVNESVPVNLGLELLLREGEHGAEGHEGSFARQRDGAVDNLLGLGLIWSEIVGEVLRRAFGLGICLDAYL